MKASLNQFDTIATIYDSLARIVFGEAIRKSQKHFLGEIPKYANVLILGGGTGWIASELLKVNDAITITYIEASAKMLGIAKRDLADYKSKIDFVHGTEDSIPVNVKFDAVITNFFFDLFTDEQLEKVIDRIRKNLSSKSIWIVTEFVNERWWHRRMLSIMYNFFRLAVGLKTEKLPQWSRLLKLISFEERSSARFCGRFITASLFVNQQQYLSPAVE